MLEQIVLMKTQDMGRKICEFCAPKPVRIVRFSDFWYTKINLTQIW